MAAVREALRFVNQVPEAPAQLCAVPEASALLEQTSTIELVDYESIIQESQSSPAVAIGRISEDNGDHTSDLQAQAHIQIEVRKDSESESGEDEEEAPAVIEPQEEAKGAPEQ